MFNKTELWLKYAKCISVTDTWQSHARGICDLKQVVIKVSKEAAMRI